MNLEAAYAAAVATPSDINQHLPALRLLASMSPRVVELGVRGGVSTLALLAARPQSYVGYDLVGPPRELADFARSAGVQYIHKIQSTLDQSPEFAPECDLLFVDTLHQAEQVRRELEIFAPRTRLFIAFHDTETFGVVGEGGGEGLLVGINQYLAEHPDEWIEISRFPNNNGLLILARSR